MNVLFFDSHTFLAREVNYALSRVPGIRLVAVTIPERLTAVEAAGVFEQIKPHLPGVVISINDAGYDPEAKLSSLIAQTGAIQAVWYLDDPFYEYVIANRHPPCTDGRVDFVTELSYVPRIRAEGRRAFFLPLGADTRFFNNQGVVPYERDAAFVGNSSLEFVESLLDEQTAGDLEGTGALISRMRRMYEEDPTVDLPAFLNDHPELWETSIRIGRERFIFTAVWMVGYFYRRDFIAGIARTLGSRFTCFGDGYWSRWIDPARVSAEACYYTNLSRYYRSTRINLNLNRIQIRTSFTQRIFDCLACGAFLLTERRELNSRFFTTTGPDPELVEFNSRQHCLSLIDYYCAHADERESIAAAGMERVLKEHTYDRRIATLFDILKSEFRI